jgi:hypothetical protein
MTTVGQVPADEIVDVLVDQESNDDRQEPSVVHLCGRRL